MNGIPINFRGEYSGKIFFRLETETKELRKGPAMDPPGIYAAGSAGKKRTAQREPVSVE